MPFSMQPGYRAVIMTCTITDTPAFRIKSGQRHDKNLRIKHLCICSRDPLCQTRYQPVRAPRTSSRNTMVVLSWTIGRQSLAPLARRLSMNGRASISERIGKKPETDCTGGKRNHALAVISCLQGLFLSAEPGQADRASPEHCFEYRPFVRMNS